MQGTHTLSIANRHAVVNKADNTKSKRLVLQEIEKLLRGKIKFPETSHEIASLIVDKLY